VREPATSFWASDFEPSGKPGAGRRCRRAVPPDREQRGVAVGGAHRGGPGADRPRRAAVADADPHVAAPARPEVDAPTERLPIYEAVLPMVPRRRGGCGRCGGRRSQRCQRRARHPAGGRRADPAATRRGTGHQRRQDPSGALPPGCPAAPVPPSVSARPASRRRPTTDTPPTQRLPRTAVRMPTARRRRRVADSGRRGLAARRSTARARFRNHHAGLPNGCPRHTWCPAPRHHDPTTTANRPVGGVAGRPPWHHPRCHRVPRTRSVVACPASSRVYVAVATR